MATDHGGVLDAADDACSHARHLVRRHADALAAAAHADPPIRLTVHDSMADLRAEVGVVDALLAEGAHIEDLVALAQKSRPGSVTIGMTQAVANIVPIVGPIASVILAGIVAVIEPAFWLCQMRTNLGTFIDYFSTITGFERFRAGQFGIRHYCTIGMNPKEANNVALAEEVLAVLPRYLTKEGVVAVGEIGYDEQTPQEDKVFRAQIELAKEFDLPIMIHTPHRDKTRGTQRTMDVLEEHGFDPARCVIDHNNEETVREVLDRGYWCAFTIYPSTKMGNERLAALVQQYGSERVIVDSSCDWGVSDPLAVPKTARLMADKGIAADTIHQVVYKNALAIYGLNGEMHESHWLQPQAIDQRTLYEGNSVLRGQEPKVTTRTVDANVIR